MMVGLLLRSGVMETRHVFESPENSEKNQKSHLPVSACKSTIAWNIIWKMPIEETLR